jgi:hypothetical protein
MTAPSSDLGEGIVEREPVRVFLAGFAALVGLGLVAADAMDWIDVTHEQTAALVVFVGALCALVSETLRAKVYSPATVTELTAPG